MRFGEIKCHEITSRYHLKNTSYFHHDDAALLLLHTQTIYCRPIKSTLSQFYVSTSEIKTTWLELTKKLKVKSPPRTSGPETERVYSGIGAS